MERQSTRLDAFARLYLQAGRDKIMPKVYNKYHKNAPPDAVYVGRPSKWGNPFKIGDPLPWDRERNLLDREDVLRLYDDWLHHDLNAKPIYDAAKVELKGKDLVCWCAPKGCHADVLLQIANEE